MTSQERWLAHALVLLLELFGAVAIAVWWHVSPMVVALWFVLFAAAVSIAVALVRNGPQVAVSHVAVVLVVAWLANGGVERLVKASHFGAPSPFRPPEQVPFVAPAPPPQKPAQPSAPPKPAPIAPGWEGSPILASMSMVAEGSTFRIRYVPHFAGELWVSATHPAIPDIQYGRVECVASPEQEGECVMELREPMKLSACVLEVGGSYPHARGATVTIVRVDERGNARPGERPSLKSTLEAEPEPTVETKLEH